MFICRFRLADDLFLYMYNDHSQSYDDWLEMHFASDSRCTPRGPAKVTVCESLSNVQYTVHVRINA